MCSIVTVLPRTWASKTEASIGTDILAPVGKVPKNVRTVDHNAQPYNLEAAEGGTNDERGWMWIRKINTEFKI